MVLVVSELFYQKIINFQITGLDVEIIQFSGFVEGSVRKDFLGKERNIELLWFGAVTLASFRGAMLVTGLCTWVEVRKVELKKCFHF